MYNQSPPPVRPQLPLSDSAIADALVRGNATHAISPWGRNVAMPFVLCRKEVSHTPATSGCHVFPAPEFNGVIRIHHRCRLFYPKSRRVGRPFLLFSSHGAVVLGICSRYLVEECVWD